MAKTIRGWKRQGEALWRVHNEAWKRKAPPPVFLPVEIIDAPHTANPGRTVQ